MGIYRVVKDKNYVTINKTVLNDDQLSWKAKGIMAYMLSMPDDWTFYVEELIKHSTDGEKSFRAGFKELKDRGYVKRVPIREGQRIVSWETHVYETPLLADFVHVENVDVQNVLVQNDGLLSNNSILSNDIKLNNNNIYTSPKKKKINSTSKKTKLAEFVSMTQEEYKKLIEQFGEENANERIETLNLYKGSTGKKYKSDYLTILNWARKEKKGANNGTNIRSNENAHAEASKISAANERRKKLANIQSNTDIDVSF
ncbi:phage replication protein [Niallia circulans]|uniref:hypothetical protein n=1 Tax=Niallia circulans TaxID=1397 RepID=UPI00077CCF49|nr:hypothetical protein [Niallia circulans]MED3839744.1 DNA-binding protein [Niallia circulans]MED4241230.1 DNA-binding protein [Niallia circulans]MED4247891.1 DNA-binding protein [Niallia circulans]SPU11003.1 phage replication protein [Niallia circulans]